MQVSTALLVCVISLSNTATVYGGLLVADHPTGLEVNALGDSVMLQCSATSTGEISHWLFNGAQLDPASFTGVGVSTTPGAGGSSTLSISSYEATHAGEYRCVARSLQGGDVVEVSHAAPVSHFAHRTFSTQPQDFMVYALPPASGSSEAVSREAAAFNCEFSTLPRFGRRPVIVWEYFRALSNTTEVINSSGSMAQSSFQYDHIGYFQLHFPENVDDGSRVRCLARHPDDPSQQVESQWATITISGASRPNDFPVFTTQMPSEMHSIDGQQLIMGCSKSTPTTSVELQWLGTRNGALAFHTAGLQFIVFRSDIVPYGHSNVRVLDGSVDGIVNETFTCRVNFGSDEFRWTTTIVQPPPPLPPLVYNDPSSSLTVDYGLSGFLLRAENYTGRVTWWYNGARLPTDGSSQKYSLSSDTLNQTVLDVVLDDAGLYQAELTDVDPPQFLNFRINIRGDAAFVLPPPVSELEVDVDTPSVLFDCLTDGNIPPVTSRSWSFNGAPISPDNSKYILCPNGSLAVNNIQPSDAGMYSCTPQNPLGSYNSSSVTLIVNAPPGVPSISHVTVVDGMSILVNWTALDDVKNYTLEIRTSDERDGDDSDDRDDTHDSKGQETIETFVLDTNTYVIGKADFDLVYYFRVKATNDVGSSDYSTAYEFTPETTVETGRGKRRVGLRGWEIALIVIFIILILLLCCVFFVCLFICWRRENRTYYAAKKEKEMQDGGLEAYRQTGEPDSKDV